MRGARDKIAKQFCAGDEAIQTASVETILDCFAEPVIGPRFARTRWLAMTVEKPERDNHDL
ncbi:hypothetical protein CWO91_16190 [Bradyrhizobium genosp. SA-3]|nr:hypothetical protein CWO91_16190 [Bradyrhizobium genosp. SA-3]